MKNCIYYQAKIERSLCWMVTSTFRYTEHLAFDRCCDKKNSIFEFFVTPDLEDVFLQVINSLKKRGVVLSYEKMENRYL